MSAFIVVVPARHPKLFLATCADAFGRPTWTDQYPWAHRFDRPTLAAECARSYRGMVYEVGDYERGDGPVEVFL